MLLRHYLERGLSKAQIARELGVSRRTVYHWLETGQLERDLDEAAVQYRPRPAVACKIDAFRPIIDARLAEFPKLTATRLFDEIRVVVTAQQQGVALDIARFDPDGAPDAAFGRAGRVHVIVARCRVPVSSRIDPCPHGPTGLVLQRDGRLVQIGRTYEDQEPATVLVRYLRDGTLDTSFGNAGVTPGHPLGTPFTFRLVDNTTAAYDEATERMYTGGDLIARYLLAPTPGAMTLSTTANPAPGDAVTLSATMLGTFPSGTVTFLDAGIPISGCVDAVSTTLTPTSATSTCHATLAAGNHPIVGAYFGNPSNSPQFSPLLVQSVGAPPDTVGVEYLNSAFGDYFVTTSAEEQALLDGGAVPGWQRTGETFSVFARDAPQTTSLCRWFSGTAFAPRSVHFFSRYDADCALGPPWLPEGYVMPVMSPGAGGACAAGTRPLYRLYDGSRGGVPLHRYVVSAAIREAMIAQGWIAEGDGIGVMACVPI